MADTARSSSVLKSYFLTGETPTQQQFADWLTSYNNQVDNNLIFGNNAAVTAVYPSAQSTATLLTNLVNHVGTGGAGISAVKLPPAVIGNQFMIYTDYGQSLDVYPNTGENINQFSVNVALRIPDNSAYLFTCLKNGIWQALNMNNPSVTYKNYKAIVNQSGSAAPVSTVLNNTTGVVPTWTYTSAGIYVLTATGLFDVSKTLIKASISIPESPHNGGFTIQASVHTSPNTILVWTLDDGFTNVDNNQFFLDIDIYP